MLDVVGKMGGLLVTGEKVIRSVDWDLVRGGRSFWIWRGTLEVVSTVVKG